MLHPAAIRSKMHFFKSSPHHYTLNNSWMNKCSSLMQYHKSLRLWSAYHRHTCSSGLTFAKCILPNRGITPHHAKAIYPGTLHRAGGWMLYVRHPNKPDNTRTDTDMHTHTHKLTDMHAHRQTRTHTKTHPACTHTGVWSVRFEGSPKYKVSRHNSCQLRWYFVDFHRQEFQRQIIQMVFCISASPRCSCFSGCISKNPLFSAAWKEKRKARRKTN